MLKHTKMSVKLRENIKSSGAKSLYLDIVINGKRHKEYLGIVLKPAKTTEEKERNRELKRLAETIRAKREIELHENNYDLKPSYKRNVDFIEYYQKYLDEYKHTDKRIVKYSFRWFVDYLQTQGIKRLKPTMLDEALCKGYWDYLQRNLNGETPYNYFNKFKQVIRQAINDELIYKNPTARIKVGRDEGLKKEILSLEEIQTLAKAPCPNNEVKRAFIFSLYTGLRWCDVKELTYRNVDYSNRKLRYIQAKTKHKSKNASNILDLSPFLLNVIGKIKNPDDKIFKLPSHTGALKILRAWVENAKINKRITWHCARHSFAVNQLSELKTDIKTVASLLGHSSLKYIERYSRAIDEKKKEAINKLPNINLENE